jgi:hypothetical protein
MMGQSRRSDHVAATSGLPQSTDIVRVGRLVRKVPIPEVTFVFQLASCGNERVHGPAN